MYKLVKLFNVTKRKEIIALVKYEYQAFKLRLELIAVNWDVLPCLLLTLRPLSNLKLLLRHAVFVCYRSTDYAVLLYECFVLCTRLYGPVAYKQLIKNPESWNLLMRKHTNYSDTPWVAWRTKSPATRLAIQANSEAYNIRITDSFSHRARTK